MSNFDITTVNRQTDKRMNGQTNGKQAPMSQSQEVREMFHTRFDGCLVLWLIIILTLT